MKAFFSYLGEMIKLVFQDIGEFFFNWVAYKWTKMPQNFKDYGDRGNAYASNFGFGGWLMYVIFWLLILGVIGAAGFGIFLLLKKYIRFVKGEIDKDTLKRQVARLNYALYQREETS